MKKANIHAPRKSPIHQAAPDERERSRQARRSRTGTITMRSAGNRSWTWLFLLWLAVLPVSAQTPTNSIPAVTNVPAVEPEGPAWSFSASAYAYIVPDSRDYVQPTVMADRGPLHLETRYNYEDLDTGSVWLGYRFGGGETLAWEVTPLLGGVFGETTGVAPGYRGLLSWWKLELCSEGEYVIDTGDASDSFFYNWSELTLAPADWFRFGLVTQRTRAYETDRDVQRGLLAGFSFRRLDVAGYVFNLDESRPTVVLAVSLGF